MAKYVERDGAMVPVDRDGNVRSMEVDGKVYRGQPLPLVRQEARNYPPSRPPPAAPEPPMPATPSPSATPDKAAELPAHAGEAAPYGRCGHCLKPLPAPKLKKDGTPRGGRRKGYCNSSCKSKARYLRKKGKKK